MLITSSRVQSGSQQVFLRDVLAGLRSSPKRLPCKYFYDARGAELFERICELDEYYLTRAELAIMEEHAPEMGAAIGPEAMMVEYGSGSSVKTRYLLDALVRPGGYVPIDVSGEQLQMTARELARDYPHLEVRPVCADFTRPRVLPKLNRRAQKTVIYFPGSTIGNFLPEAATGLLRQIRGQIGAEGGLLIGIDLVKDVSRIEAAYNDRKGVTAAFNLNLLRRINRELGADFRVEEFCHWAPYNRAAGRIEMHLVSQRPQVVNLGGEAIEFAAGETICTEYSHKYSVEGFAAMAEGAGLSLRRTWLERRGDFAVLFFEALRAR